MKLRRFREVLELTVAEQRLVIAVLLLVVLAVWITYQREPRMVNTPAAVQPSPSPGIRP